MLDLWIKAALESSGISQSELSRQLTERLRRSIDRAAINKMATGRREIRGDELLEIEAITGHPVPNRQGIRMVKVRGAVQAGAWEETWEWADDDVYSVAIPDDADLRPFALYGAETRGPSMNRRYAEGTVLVFTDLVETGEAPALGARYLIERERASGEIEATVKTLWQDDAGKTWLLPESDDPRFQEPVPVDDVESGTVRLLGRVKYAVARE